MRYFLFLCFIFLSLRGFCSTDTIAYYYPDKIYLFLCESPEQYIQATEFLIEEDRKTAATDMYGRLKGYVSDTNQGLKTHYLLLTELINNMGGEGTSKAMLFQDAKIPSGVFFINDFTGVKNPNMSTTQNAIAYGSKRKSTIQPITAGDYLISAGKNKNKSIITAVVGTLATSALFAVYGNNQEDALLYLGAGTGAVTLGLTVGFGVKGNKDLKSAGKLLNEF